MYYVPQFIKQLFPLLHLDPGTRICDLNAKLLRAVEDDSALPRRHAVSDLSNVGLLVHQKHINFIGGVHHYLVITAGKPVAGLLVSTITDLGSENGTLEATPHPTVNTLRLPPVLLHGY